MECEGFTLEGEITIKFFSSEESINDDIELYDKNGDVFDYMKIYITWDKTNMF